VSDPLARTPGSLLAAYAAPYFVYVALAALAELPRDAVPVDAARAVAVTATLAWYWRSYRPLRGARPVAGSVLLGAVAGLVGVVLWVALLAPFCSADAAPWPGPAWAARAVVATALPPVFEELLFRGYALPVVLLYQRARAAKSATPFLDAFDRARLGDVAPGAWSALAVGISSALFAAGHHPAEWLAALAYGALMSALWIARGDLVSCISAHATTNAVLALWVRASGEWMYW
jgi:membrane protease YdiL (CAAX protease family)